MSFNFIVPQSPAGAVPALYYIPPNAFQFQQQAHKSPTTAFSFLHPKFKTEMCNKYDPMLGCPYGDQCQFRHPEDPHPSESVMKRMSQIGLSDGTNSVSANNSMGLMNRGGRFAGRSLAANGSGGDFRHKPVFNSQYNGRQTKGNPNSPFVRQPNKFFGGGDCGDAKCNNKTNKVFHHEFLSKSPPTAFSFLHPKFKTEVCNKYDPMLGCPYGDQCQFRHPEDPHPSESVMKRMSQIGLSDGSNSVSTNNSTGLSVMNRGGRFAGRSLAANGGGGGGGDFRHKPVFNSQYNGRQFSKTKGNPNSPFSRQSNKFFGGGGGDDCGDPKCGNKTSKVVHREFLNEKTLPNFVKFASKVPKSGMRRYNSQETIGYFTYSRVSSFKKRVNNRFNIVALPSCITATNVVEAGDV